VVRPSLETILRIVANEPVFPRITAAEVERLLRATHATGSRPEHVAIPDGLGIGRLILPPGRLITPLELSELRESVLSDLVTAGFASGSRLSNDDKSRWDRTVGASLLGCLPISAVQASDRGVWAYMTTFVFWDFPGWRYSGTRRARTAAHDGDEAVPLLERTAGGPRNVLRKCWIRAHVLGPDLCIEDAPPGAEHLKEDELVNLFERSTLGDDYVLARELARAIYRNRPSAERRMDFTRELTKRVLRRTVSTHFSHLGQAAGELLDEIASGIEG